jgi:hypothetical protein
MMKTFYGKYFTSKQTEPYSFLFFPNLNLNIQSLSLSLSLSLFFFPHAAFLSLILTHAVSLSAHNLLSPANDLLSLSHGLNLTDSRSQSHNLTIRISINHRNSRVTATITLTDLPSQTHGLTVALSLSLEVSVWTELLKHMYFSYFFFLL